jgi:recA bacterial DNA recombination protein
MASLSVRLQPTTEPVALAFPEKAAALSRQLATEPRLAHVTPASRLEVRPAPEMVSSGILEMDALAGGLPRGCLTEIYGPASSGRTSVLVAALAAATQREEACALVDTTDAFDPLSAARVQFKRLLWVRCGDAAQTKACHAERSGSFAKRGSRAVEASLPQSRSVPGVGIPRFARNDNYRKLEQALRVADLLLQSGGFGLVAIDLSDVPLPAARRIPLASWFRFQRAVESTPTVLLIVTQAPCAATCAALLVKLSAFRSPLSERAGPAHAQIFAGMQVEGELLRSRVERKPAASARSTFTTKAAWAG